MANPNATINGERYSWTNLELSIPGLQFPEVKSLDYSIKRGPGVMRGNRQQPAGRTGGTVEYTASIELYMGSYKELQTLLGAGWMKKVFNITAQWAANASADINTAELLYCQITTDGHSSSEGSADAATMKLELSVMRIKVNGLDPVDEQ